MSDATIKNHASFIWSVADLLRGDYRQSEYGKVILPLTVLRRLDCVLEPTKEKVLARHAQMKGKAQNLAPILEREAGQQFFNTSRLDFQKLLAAPNDIADQLRYYIGGFSEGARDIIEHFDFDSQITRLEKANLLYLVVSRFADIDLHPNVVSNLEMGYLYEELIRRFSELSNETAGEHFTPREVIRLMVNLLFIEDDDLLSKPGIVKTLFDPACGTGGMLSVAEDHLRQLNPQARLEVFGQELNAESYAICRSDMMLKGQDASNIAKGNSFSEDGHPGRTFDYLLANPPFGVEWKKVEDVVKAEHQKLGFGGRFGAGLPRINDGSFLFLQHMISKMKPLNQGGSRLAIVFNGSPLFTGAAGSGESEIRRWIIENDWLEAVVALPDQLFYNTGISTYFWIVTNRKRPERRGKVQLVDAREMFTTMRKSLGEKRKEISDDQTDELVHLYGDFKEEDRVRILRNEAFGFLRVTVEQPLRLGWEVSDATVERFKSLPLYRQFISEGVDDADGRQTETALMEMLDQCFGQKFASVVQLSEALGTAAQSAWERLGWEVDAVSGAGAFAKALGITSSQASKLMESLAVRSPHAPPVVDPKGNLTPDAELRDNENVPLPPMPVSYEAEAATRLQTVEYRTAVEDYLTTEVRPFVSNAWVDHSKTKLGYEIPLTRHFYKYSASRPLQQIDEEIRGLESEIQDLLREVTE